MLTSESPSPAFFSYARPLNTRIHPPPNDPHHASRPAAVHRALAAESASPTAIAPAQGDRQSPVGPASMRGSHAGLQRMRYGKSTTTTTTAAQGQHTMVTKATSHPLLAPATQRHGCQPETTSSPGKAQSCPDDSQKNHPSTPPPGTRQTLTGQRRKEKVPDPPRIGRSKAPLRWAPRTLLLPHPPAIR